MDYKAITVFRPGGVGDTILAAPMLQLLREESKAKISYIGHLEAGQLLKSAGLVDEALRQGVRATADNIYSGAIEIAGRMGLTFEGERRKAAIKSLGEPDLIIAFSPDEMGLSYAFEQIGVPRFTVQNWHPGAGMHQSESQVLALRNLGYMRKTEVRKVDFKCDPPAIPYLNPSKSVIINPSSGLSYKNWPLEKWIELSVKLSYLGYEVLVLQGPAERNLGYKTVFRGSRIVDLSLKEIAGLLSLNMPYIGNDSGVTHMAAISGSPVIGLYGPTHPDNWGPVGPDVHVIRNCASESTGALRVCNDDNCMNSITVHQVLDIFIREIK